jgi:protein-disulfide isomerase
MTNSGGNRAMSHYLYRSRTASKAATVTRMPETVRLVEPDSRADHILGSPEAPVTVIEYGDFECPRCKQAAGALKLEEIHPRAMQAAQVAECAGGQGRFWEMHDLLFENQRRLELRRLHGYARRLGLDMPRFTAAMDDEVYLQRVREHRRGGEYSRVRSTPTPSAR